MLPGIAALFVAYGLCFGFQNKLTFLHERTDFTDRLLACTYCTGFHCGWLTWVLFWAASGDLPATGPVQIAASVLVWAFASSAWCYSLDAAVKYLEENA